MESIKRIDERTIEISLSTIVFEEDGLFVCLSPALNTSGYGSSREDAIESFKIVVEDFIEDNLRKEKLENALLALGWAYDDKEVHGDLDGKTLKREMSEYSGIATQGVFYAYSETIAAVA